MSQEKLDHVVAGAIFDFMGWLTTRQEKLVLSSADDAAPAAEAVKEFLTMRGVAQDCEPMIHDWPARCSMVTANAKVTGSPASSESPCGLTGQKEVDVAKVLMTVELEYDADVVHGDGEEGNAWFFEEILSEEKGLLLLHSNEIGATVGKIRVLSAAPSNAMYHATPAE